MIDAYDPLNYDNLARSVVAALLEKEPEPLPPIKLFGGAGVYAIYYTGDFKAYTLISKPKYKTPIYVGKAIPAGGRKGQTGVTPSSGNELLKRLQEHAKSIEQVSNLHSGEFACRYLVVLPVWVSLAEQFLINHYRPIWNLVLDGFGNHPPGAGRKDMRRPRWDIVHPGRPWANKLVPEEKIEDLLVELGNFLTGKIDGKD